MKIILYNIFLILLTCSIVKGQSVQAPFLSGARNAGIGDAEISFAQDISCMYQNPASLVFLENYSVMVNHAQIRNGIGMMENIAFPVLPKGAQMLSFGLQLYHLGYLQSPEPFRNNHILEFGYEAAFASEITNTFSIGISAGLNYGQTDNSHSTSGMYSVGIDYSPSADISYAAVFSGLGTEIQYLKSDSSFDAKNIYLNKSLEIGASLSYPSSSSLRRKFLVLSLANQKIFGYSGLYYKGGIEIRPFNFLNLRFGYVAGPDISTPRYGLGLHFGDFLFEFVFYTQQSDMLNQFSLLYDL